MSQRARIAAVLSRRDVAAGLFLIALAAAIVAGAFELPIGTPARMGAGFLPLGIGIVLGIAGIVVFVGGLCDSDPLPSFRNLRPIAALAASFLAFAAIIDAWGLAAATFAAVITAGLATPARRAWEMAFFAAALAAFAIVLFIEFLGLPMRVWPW
jgi:hypothetical protein